MDTFLLAAEDALRVGGLFAMLAAMTVWERAAPRRPPSTRSRLVGRSSNLIVMVLGALSVRLVFPILGSATAVLAANNGWGLFNLWDTPTWIAIAISFLCLDALIYGQHRMFHALPVLWRLHRMHHADTEMDVTTGVRFHPLEIVLSMAIKLAGVLALGAPVTAVILFELVLNATSLFNHSNIAVPVAADRWLRLFVVTPDMHRVHHSVRPEETASNFGFNLPWWDRLFGSYTPRPRDGHEHMTIGLDQFRAPGDARIDRLLIQPFLSGGDNE